MFCVSFAGFQSASSASLPALTSAETPSPSARGRWLAYMLEDLASGKLSQSEFVKLLAATFPDD